jgi:hypothetical protein
MKQLETKLINSIFKSDLLLFKDYTYNQTIEINISSFNKILSSIKQLTKILESNKKLPLFLVCQNKQYSLLIKRYMVQKKKQTSQVCLISYKSAVTLKIPAIFFLIDCNDSNLLCSKIQQQSNSIIYLIEKKQYNQKTFGEYFLDLNIISIKQILFILSIIKKIKNINANI